jgi:hypothetical protein
VTTILSLLGQASYQLISDPEKELLTSLAIRQQNRNSDGFRHIAAQPSDVSSRHRQSMTQRCPRSCSCQPQSDDPFRHQKRASLFEWRRRARLVLCTACCIAVLLLLL